jgi:hypothetical protein
MIELNQIKRILCTVTLICITFFSSAQEWPFERWHEGKVVLVQGDTLRGLVKYDLQQDLIQLQYTAQDKKAEVFTARKVLFFEIFDAAVNKYRQFFALPYAATVGYKTPVFFELLEEGKLTVLVREQLEYKVYNSPYYAGSYSRLVLTHRYFLLKPTGDIEEFKANRGDLLNLMSDKSDIVEKYVRANRLKFDEKYHLSKILAYYNSLFRT